MSDINREDLTLLMDAYRKQTEVNVQLQAQQGITLDKMNRIIDLQEKTCEIVNNSSKSFSDSVDKLLKEMGNDRLNRTTEHNSINNKIYVALIGMSTIILTLIALIFK